MKNKKLLKVLATLAIGSVSAIGLTFAGCGHKHTYSEKWSMDETGHWHEATCDDLHEGDSAFKSGFAAHAYGDDDECDVCGYVRTPSEGGEDNPGGGEDNPGGGEDNPGGGEDNPGGGEDNPGGGEDNPGGGEDNPGGGEDNPGGGEDNPGGGEDNPGGGEDNPGGGEDNPGGGEQDVTISLNHDTLILNVINYEAELVATVSGDYDVEWTSDNEDVVLVGNGYVEALKPGAATITATVKGTGISTTCEVLVEDAYYLIGGQDSDWNKVGTFGQSSAVYFLPTETEGIYVTDSIELSAMANFQVALVGITGDNWYQSALNSDYLSTAEGNDLSVKGSNFIVQTHGYYTITLDLTDKTNPTVYGVCDEEIDDGDTVYVYYMIGTMNNWTQIGADGDAGEYAFTDNEDGTYSLTIELAKGAKFQIVVAGLGYNIAFDEGALPRELIGNSGSATSDGAYQLEWTTSADIGVGVAGEYTFTLNPDGEEHNQLTYTFKATEATDAEEEVDYVYYLFGSFNSNWAVFDSLDDIDEQYVFSNNDDGTYSLTIELNKNDAFKILAIGQQYNPEYGNQAPVEGTIGDGPATATGNFQLVYSGTNIGVGVSGRYTFTFTPDNEAKNQLAYTFTATEATEPEDAEIEYVYYLFGSFNNNWAVFNSLDDIDEQYVFTNNEDGTYSLTIDLNKDDAFKILAIGQQYNPEYGNQAPVEGTIGDGPATADGDYQLVYSSSNIGVGVSGRYTFTFTPDNAAKNQLAYTFTATEATEDADGDNTEDPAPEVGEE